jgi:hypothetical protein
MTRYAESSTSCGKSCLKRGHNVDGMTILALDFGRRVPALIAWFVPVRFPAHADELGGGTQEPDHHHVFAAIRVGLVAQATVSRKIV